MAVQDCFHVPAIDRSSAKRRRRAKIMMHNLLRYNFRSCYFGSLGWRSRLCGLVLRPFPSTAAWLARRRRSLFPFTSSGHGRTPSKGRRPNMKSSNARIKIQGQSAERSVKMLWPRSGTQHVGRAVLKIQGPRDGKRLQVQAPARCLWHGGEREAQFESCIHLSQTDPCTKLRSKVKSLQMAGWSDRKPIRRGRTVLTCVTVMSAWCWHLCNKIANATSSGD